MKKIAAIILITILSACGGGGTQFDPSKDVGPPNCADNPAQCQ